jgi:hypothetical protein
MAMGGAAMELSTSAKELQRMRAAAREEEEERLRNHEVLIQVSF